MDQFVTFVVDREVVLANQFLLFLQQFLRLRMGMVGIVRNYNDKNKSNIDQKRNVFKCIIVNIDAQKSVILRAASMGMWSSRSGAACAGSGLATSIHSSTPSQFSSTLMTVPKGIQNIISIYHCT